MASGLSSTWLTGLFTLLGVAGGAFLSYVGTQDTQREALEFQRSQENKEKFIAAVVSEMESFEQWDDYTSDILYRLAAGDTVNRRVKPDHLFEWTTNLFNNTNRLALIADSAFALQTIGLRNAMMQSMDSSLTHSSLPFMTRVQLNDSTGSLFESWVNAARRTIREFDGHVSNSPPAAPESPASTVVSSLAGALLGGIIGVLCSGLWSYSTRTWKFRHLKDLEGEYVCVFLQGMAESEPKYSIESLTVRQNKAVFHGTSSAEHRSKFVGVLEFQDNLPDFAEGYYYHTDHDWDGYIDLHIKRSGKQVYLMGLSEYKHPDRNDSVLNQLKWYKKEDYAKRKN